jgi:hypothetical protein
VRKRARGKACADILVTDLAQSRRKDGRPTAEQVAPGLTKQEVLALTGIAAATGTPAKAQTPRGTRYTEQEMGFRFFSVPWRVALRLGIAVCAGHLRTPDGTLARAWPGPRVTNLMTALPSVRVLGVSLPASGVSGQ